MDLPIEINYKILSFVNSTKTYLNCRIVCKDWHKKLEDVIIFKNGKKKEMVKFFNDKIEFWSIENNKLSKLITFGKYGYFKYIKYSETDEYSQLVIENKPPFKLESHYKQLYSGKIKKCDIRKEKIYTNYYSLPGCNIS